MVNHSVSFKLQVKAEDIELNVCKKKHLTNTRSSSADEALTLVPPRVLSLEQAIDFIGKQYIGQDLPILPGHAIPWSKPQYSPQGYKLHYATPRHK